MEEVLADDFRLGTIIWGAVVTIVLCTFIIVCYFGVVRDVERDEACIAAGKSVTWRSIEGVADPKKECVDEDTVSRSATDKD